MNCQSILSLSHLGFQYPSRELSTREHPLLHQISFDLPSASILHIRGPNGCGKTSLLKLLAGMFRPDSGTIRYAGEDIWANLAAYQRNLRYLGHKNGFNPALTIWEHCQLDWQMTSSEQHTKTILQDLELWAVRDYACDRLSAGQRRRVALLRLLLSPAQLWLLDEPLVALDSEGVAFLVTCLQQQIEKGGQVIYTSHQSLPWDTPGHQEYAL